MSRIRARHVMLASVFSLGGIVSPTFAQTAEPLQPRIDAGAKIGTERSLGTMEGWAPIIQKDDGVLYTDIRWMADDNNDQEGNLGLGYRQIVNDKIAGNKAIVGAHGWIDRRRTDRGSNFYQLTGGLEYLKEDWDVKANAYVPLNSEKTYTTANSGNANPYLAGTGIFVDTNGQLIEEAQPGGDLEIGYRIPAFEQNIDAIRVYGGGYGFKGGQSDDTVGGRVRASVDVTPLLNVGARFQYDEPRGSQAFVEATLRFPFTAKKRFQRDKLRARLDESPERDIDIVTNAKVTDTGRRKEVINTTSNQTQRVLHVDNTAANGGDGSKENPFNTLASAQAALLNNDVVYVHQGNGTASGQNQGFVINKSNVQLIGSGVDLIFDTDKFKTRNSGITPTDGTLIAAATAAPVLTNVNNTGNVIDVTNDNALITGVTVASVTNGNGILADSANQSFDQITVDRVNFQGNGTLGLYVVANGVNGYWDKVNITNNNATSAGPVVMRVGANTAGKIGDVTITDNTFSNPTGINIQVRTDNVASTIDNAVIKNNTITTGSGVGSAAINASFNNGLVDHLEISDNTVNSTTGFGIYVVGNNTGRLNSGLIKNNIITNATNAGVSITGLASSVMNDLAIEDNDVSDIPGDTFSGFGYTINNTSTSQINNVMLSGNKSFNTYREGILLTSTGSSSTISGSLVDNEISNVTFATSALAGGGTTSGLTLVIENGASLTASVSGLTSTNNIANGVRISDRSTGSITADFGGGTLGSTGGNRIYGNTGTEIRIDMDGDQLKAENNWWGLNTGLSVGETTLEAGSTIDATPFLTTDPRD